MALFSYDDTSRREDLLSILKDVSPISDNYLTTNLGTSVAQNSFHEWLVFNLNRATSVTFTAEGAEVTEPTHTQPTRSNNITAIIRREVKVSGTERAIRVGLPGDPMDFQKKVVLRQLKQDMEYAVINGTRASGASGTARGMTGINGVISTNLTARNSGTSMSTTELEDIIQNSWDAVGAEFVADTVLCPMGIKRKIATFTTRVTPYQESSDRVYNNISFYESSSGVVKIIPHKDVINGTGTTHVYALNLDTYKMAFLKGREPQFIDVPATGDYDRGMYLTEMTLESLAERASVKRYGYSLTG
jgi:hypothetical protein